MCLIVLASFVIFVVDQTSAASTHQQNEVREGSVSGSSASSSKHEGTLHKTIDEAADTLTSPFADIVSGSSSQWVIHGVRTLLALLVYGFGLSFLSRVIRVRV